MQNAETVFWAFHLPRSELLVSDWGGPLALGPSKIESRPALHRKHEQVRSVGVGGRAERGDEGAPDGGVFHLEQLHPTERPGLAPGDWDVARGGGEGRQHRGDGLLRRAARGTQGRVVRGDQQGLPQNDACVPPPHQPAGKNRGLVHDHVRGRGVDQRQLVADQRFLLARVRGPGAFGGGHDVGGGHVGSTGVQQVRLLDPCASLDHANHVSLHPLPFFPKNPATR